MKLENLSKELVRNLSKMADGKSEMQVNLNKIMEIKFSQELRRGIVPKSEPDRNNRDCLIISEVFREHDFFQK